MTTIDLSRKPRTLRDLLDLASEDNLILTTSDGRPLSVPLDKLTAEDRAFLLKHFNVESAPTSTQKPHTIYPSLRKPSGRQSTISVVIRLT